MRVKGCATVAVLSNSYQGNMFYYFGCPYSFYVIRARRKKVCPPHEIVFLLSYQGGSTFFPVCDGCGFFYGVLSFVDLVVWFLHV